MRTTTTIRTAALTSARCGWLWTAVLLTGCTGDPAVVGPPLVVVRTDAANAAQCPNGGSVISSGADSNGNGALDDIEVATRTVVCGPGPIAPRVVIRLVAEPPGRNCFAGGTAVQSGADANGNGTLDDAEVAHTDYACGEVLLTRLAAEPEGVSCPFGGVTFFAGRDRDGDHMLDDGEIEVTEYHCGDTLSRDVDIKSAEDAAALANLRAIAGKLTIDVEAFDVISLPHLEHVGGAFEVRPLQLNRLSLPELRDVDGPFTLGAAIAVIDCPQLARVGAFTLETRHLHDLSGLPAVTQVDHDVKISGTSDLVSVDLSNLLIGGDLSVADNKELTEVAIALRDRVGSVTFHDNGALETVDLSVAPSGDTAATMGAIESFTNAKLSHLALAADRIASLNLSGSPVIADLALDVARFDSAVAMSGILKSFRMALSSPRGAGQIEFASFLSISGALETLVSADPVIVDGGLDLDRTRLRSLDAGARIASVRGGIALFNNALLTDIAPFPLGGGLQLMNNASLSTMPLLPLLDPSNFGRVVITDNPLLTSVPSLAQLERTNGIQIEHNPSLGQLLLPVLRWGNSNLTVFDNDALGEIALPLLERADFVFIADNALLQTIDLPAMVNVSAQLFIESNPKLHHMVFDALTGSGFFKVEGNPKLPTCEVLGIFSHFTGGTEQSGNDNTASCLN